MEKFIMITAARLVPLKQIDRFIRVLIRMPDRYDFLYLIAGHGTHGYEKYLYKIAGPLMEKGKIRFTGFLRNETLVKYLNSADLFVLTSTSEGCSVAVIEALACELPVFSTRTGDTAELMLQESAGCLVGINEYEKWEKGLREIFDGRKIDILDRNIAKQHYDWRNIAYRFIALCREILK
jgi:glycosyltransferase involved in cell wall biosynthesis